MTPRLVWQKAVSGSSTLLQYFGNPGDIISVTVYVIDFERVFFNNMKLGLIRSHPLSRLRNQVFIGGSPDIIQLTYPVIMEANINGVASLVIPSDAISAGLTLLADGVILS